MIDKELGQRADSGDLEAIMEVAELYFSGQEGYDKRGEAFALYTKALAIDPENATAINRIGTCYINGYGVDQDGDIAMTFYRRAAEMGSSAAQYNLADGLRDAGDPECLTWFQKAYENGDVDAPYEIALIYKAGSIVPRDEEKAMEYFRLAADAGNEKAMLDLGNAYLSGEMVAKDEEKGIEFTRKAAEAGNATAANNMSLLYRQGQGVPCDIGLSIEWAKKAAVLGDSDQAFFYSLAYFNGNPPVAEDKAKALEFFKIAADGGSITGMENAGVCYLNGYGTEKDDEKATSWFERAAEHGSEKGIDNLRSLYPVLYGKEEGEKKYLAKLHEIADDEGYYIAMVKLYFCYSEGLCAQKDIPKALEYLDRAVKDNYAPACLIKGNLYYDGALGMPEDKEAAFRLFCVAAKKDNYSAIFNVGMCTRDGIGTQKDVHKAIECFQKCADETGDVRSLWNLYKIYSEGEDGVAANPALGVEYLTKAADLGNGDALFELGLDYFYGKYVAAQSDEKAVECFMKGGEAGHHACAKNVGLCYKDGRGVPQDNAKAMEWLEKAADLGSVDAYLQLGNAYNDNGIWSVDYQKAAEYYQKAYNAGAAEGALRLGIMYESGHGVDADLEEALKLYQTSADQGDVFAIMKLGFFYLDGKGVEKDVAKAVAFFEKAKAAGEPQADEILSILYSGEAKNIIDPKKQFEFYKKRAEEGDAEAQYQVYNAYYEGVGTEKNQVLADQWLTKAADNGHVIAQALAGFQAIHITKDAAKGVSYLEKAAAGGHLMAKHDLAELYLDGFAGIPMDKERAISLLMENAEDGYAKSQGTLGICYATGNGVPVNHALAVQWFEKAAMQNDPVAQKNMGVSLRRGLGVPENKAEAAGWFEKAAAQGNVQAEGFLARMLMDGEGIHTDYRRAESLLKQVLSSGDEDEYDEALFNLALLYTTKLNDNNNGFPLWRESAQRGNNVAQFNLGLCFYNGWGTTKDIDQAIYWWRQSAAQGNEDAQRNLEIALREKENGGNQPIKTQNGSSGGCYIATAVYGSYNCPEVWTLRRFRDNCLAENLPGRIFIRLYYAVSPWLIRMFGDTLWFRQFWKGKLDRLVNKLWDEGIESTPYRDRDF